MKVHLPVVDLSHVRRVTRLVYTVYNDVIVRRFRIDRVGTNKD